MWDIEEDWSEDESFGLANKLGPKRKKLEEPTGSAKRQADENSSLNQREISLSRALESLDKRLSGSERTKRVLDHGKGSEIDLGRDSETKPRTEKAKGSSPHAFASASSDLSFEQTYDTFGLNSISAFWRAGGTSKPSKLFGSVSSMEKSQRGIIRFSGVSDPSTVFFVETWGREDTAEILREAKCRKPMSLGEADLSYFAKDLGFELELGAAAEDVGLGLESESEPEFRSSMISSTYANRPILTTKYVPRSCLDLVNDECSIRSILRWIKSWDSFVFKSPSPVKGRQEAPEVPILLIGGPSGSGKTSMVKILARQCGYEVNEIRVSEERSKESFENSIKMGISFGTIGGSNRPSLIVIDELDSLSNKGSVKKSDCFDFLVRLIESHSKTRETVGRPIICICNDIHEKSLRSLRSKSLNVLVPLPPKEKIFKRLSYICRSEGLRLEDEEILNELIKTHNCDIRSCLNSIYLMSQKDVGTSDKEGDGGRDSRKTGIPIYWEDFESCFYTKDVDQDISGFVKACLGLDADIRKDDIFKYVLEHGEECLTSFGSNLTGLLTENIYRCNLIGDFYFDYLRYILDSVVEHSILSSRACSLLPFLSSVTLVSRKITGLHCNQFRHLGSSTFAFSQVVSNSNSSVYRDISSSTIDTLRVETMTNSFKVYTLPSMLTHFNGTGLLKYLNLWKSTKIFPKFKCLIGLQPDSLSSEELEPLSVLYNLVSKMVCFGFRFEDQTKALLERNAGKYSVSHFLKPNIESLYSSQCLANSISSGYIRNPSVIGPSPGRHILDIGYYTLVNQLVDFFRDDIAKHIIPGVHYCNSELSGKSGARQREGQSESPGEEVSSGGPLVSVPSFHELINQTKTRVRSERPNSLCIYRYNDGCTNAVKMEVRISDFFV